MVYNKKHPTTRGVVMVSKREVKKAFETAVTAMMAVLENKKGRDLGKVQTLAERYEALSGLSRQEADTRIAKEAERRLKKK